MKILWLILFTFWVMVFVSQLMAQNDLQIQTSPSQLIDSVKNWDAKKIKNYIQQTKQEYLNISEKKQMLEISLMSKNLRANLRSPSKKEKLNDLVEDHSSNNYTESYRNETENTDNISLSEASNIVGSSPNTWTEEKELMLLEETERKKKAEIAALSNALELQTKALQLSNLQRRNQFYIGGAILLILSISTVSLYRGNTQKKKMNVLLSEEKKKTEIERDKSDELLLNILPLPIAQELKTSGKSDVRHYALASVLFTDFKGFTTVAETMTPQELVEELDSCFARFDEIITQYHLEKIKTIGDAYMCVGGIPQPNQSNPIDAILAGLKIQQFMAEKRAEKLAQGQDYWQCRLGINSGELIAGVIGKKKFAYDVWGDTVNTGSRMESSGEVGKVNISGKTYELVKDFFEVEYRGKVNAKGKGEIDMYFVNRIKPSFSADSEGIEPNNTLLELLKNLS